MAFDVVSGWSKWSKIGAKRVTVTIQSMRRSGLTDEVWLGVIWSFGVGAAGTNFVVCDRVAGGVIIGDVRAFATRHRRITYVCVRDGSSRPVPVRPRR